jgi:hypothetical protein
MKVQNLRSADIIECRLAGIPAQIAVWSIDDYVIMDRKGYRADWLAKKVDYRDVQELIRIEENARYWSQE